MRVIISTQGKLRDLTMGVRSLKSNVFVERTYSRTICLDRLVYSHHIA